MFEITLAAPEDQEAVRRLQTLNPYPAAPIQGEIGCFVARSAGTAVGAAALEILDGEIALVRLLSVLPGYRKRDIARQLLLRLIAFAEERKVRDLYAPGLYAEEYFRRFGFVPSAPEVLPSVLNSHPFPGIEKLTGRLMHRPVQLPGPEDTNGVASTAQRYFDEGFFCAESVLAAVAEHLDIRSPLIPGIATGFCNGVASTWGTCGSISGGVLAINMMLGRHIGGAPVKHNYEAVRELIQDFQCRHGSTQCSELIACDLDTKEGRKIYRNNQLRRQCRQYVGTAAAISLKLIEENLGKGSALDKPAQ
jgi:C_GCAxxG_C_C family probable redox protein